eukprot:6864407-Pyramimonas_sp.AAC.1
MAPLQHFRHTPHTFRGPPGSSTRGPNGYARIAPPRWHTSHEDRGVIGSSTEGLHTSAYAHRELR